MSAMEGLAGFFCPITKECMNEPVAVACGHTFDRAAVLRWCVGRGRGSQNQNAKTMRYAASFAPGVAPLPCSCPCAVAVFPTVWAVPPRPRPVAVHARQIGMPAAGALRLALGSF